MLLTLSDFAGNYRLPPGASADLQPAVEQAEGTLLREFFGESTAAFIEAAPTLPPASTLVVGTPNLAPWRSVALPVVFGQLTLGVAGVGAQKAAQKGISQDTGNITLLQAYSRIAAYRRQLLRVQAEEWWGDCIVTANPPLTFQAPSYLVAWLRPGSPILAHVGGATYTGVVTAISATGVVTTDIGGATATAGASVGVRIAYELRQPRRELWT